MDMKKKLLFVFNPCSGKAQIKNQLLDIVDTMVKADYEVTIYPTQCAGDAKEKVEAYAGNYDLVVCSGGDGTLDEVVTGMMQCKAKVPLGYIPAGSTNDFASSLGIPKDMEKAAEAAVTGKPFPCDVGLFNGDYFVYVAAFGRFAGSWIMQRIRAERVLLCCALGTVMATFLIVCNLGKISLIALFLVYVFEAIMFPTIFAISLKGLGGKTKRASSFLMMSPVGGAVGPVLMGYVADNSTMSLSFIIPFVSFCIVLFYSWYADVERN